LVTQDIGIPTPNIHFPRTPYAPALPAVPPTDERPNLLFYAGGGYEL